MKITFEGTFSEILKEMEMILGAETGPRSATPEAPQVPAVDLAAVEAKLKAPWPARGPGPSVSKGLPHVDKSGDKPAKKSRTPRQLENDARLREAALAKIAANKAAGIKPFTKAPPKSDPPPLPTPPPPASAESLGLEPDEVVRIRQKTITDLQEAYANGHQQEVFELLSRFGNGAKSFRELPPESFVPIREAIDNGALT